MSSAPDSREITILISPATYQTSTLSADGASDVIPMLQECGDRNSTVSNENRLQSDRSRILSPAVQSQPTRNLRLGMKNSGPSWYRHPGIRQNKKVFIASLVFLLAGVASLIAGCVIESNPEFEEATLDGVILIVIGALLLLPGVYFVYYIIQAARGRPGFNFQQIQQIAD